MFSTNIVKLMSHRYDSFVKELKHIHIQYRRKPFSKKPFHKKYGLTPKLYGNGKIKLRLCIHDAGMQSNPLFSHITLPKIHMLEDKILNC